MLYPNFSYTHRVDLAIDAGLNQIYCTNTGMPVGTISDEELKAFIALEESMYPTLDDEDFIDHLSLAMIPACSRPSPIFQNMTPDRYHQIAIQFPSHMYRYLAGRIMFERWSHLHGLTCLEGKAEWLREINLNEVRTRDIADCVQSLIRLDAVFSLRQVYIDSAMVNRMNAIRANWPGADSFAQFIADLEALNIDKLSRHDEKGSGRINGSPMALRSAIHYVTQIDPDEYLRQYEQRKAGEILAQARAENRAKEQMRILKNKFAEQYGNGQTKVNRGINAVMGYASLGETFNSELALKMLATHDTAAAAKKRQAIQNIGKKTKDPERAKKTLESKLGTTISLKINFGNVGNKL